MQGEEIIRLEGLTKWYESGHTVLDHINLTVRRNEFLTLLGPSGCGKTTTLRLIAGFEQPSEGRILFDGQDISHTPPHQRRINTVFQKHALFPHMNVFENVAFGLTVKKLPKDEIEDRVRKMLALVNLEDYENRSVDSLSGGQQQRVAIVRALVNEPEVLLLDEPLSALDLKLRRDMQVELKRIQQRVGSTFIYVTHDQEEALTMSDHIVVMNQGYIQQEGSPEDIYNEPENAFVADFIGDSNIIHATMVRDELVNILDTEFVCVDRDFGENKPVDVVIRPEDVELVPRGKGTMPGTVSHVIFKGVHYEMEVQAGGFEWLVHSTRLFDVGSEIDIKVDPFNIQVMNRPESEDEEAMAIDE